MTELDYQQRKALRRLGRGQRINRTMWADPIISECIDTSHYLPRPDLTDMPYPQSMFCWLDWEEKARGHNRPRLNEYGKQLLKELDGDTQ